MQLTEFAVGIARQAIPAPRLDNQIESSEVVRVGEVRSEDPHLRQPVEVLWLRVDDRGTVDRALQQRVGLRTIGACRRGLSRSIEPRNRAPLFRCNLY